MLISNEGSELRDVQVLLSSCGSQTRRADGINYHAKVHSVQHQMYSVNAQLHSQSVWFDHWQRNVSHLSVVKTNL